MVLTIPRRSTRIPYSRTRRRSMRLGQLDRAAAQRRFPQRRPTILLRARSFAYGGSVIQDLGYYPFGSRFFSNLLHYVRSGDFVEALFATRGTSTNYAFALGALAHYANDNHGASGGGESLGAAGLSEARHKFGDRGHLRPGAEAARHRGVFVRRRAGRGGAYLPEAYQRFIGFASPRPARSGRSRRPTVSR